jgi:hypothetical protein
MACETQLLNVQFRISVTIVLLPLLSMLNHKAVFAF